jgi:hypothetical protein
VAQKSARFSLEIDNDPMPPLPIHVTRHGLALNRSGTVMDIHGARSTSSDHTDMQTLQRSTTQAVNSNSNSRPTNRSSSTPSLEASSRHLTVGDVVDSALYSKLDRRASTGTLETGESRYDNDYRMYVDTPLLVCNKCHSAITARGSEAGDDGGDGDKGDKKGKKKGKASKPAKHSALKFQVSLRNPYLLSLPRTCVTRDADKQPSPPSLRVRAHNRCT